MSALLVTGIGPCWGDAGRRGGVVTDEEFQLPPPASQAQAQPQGDRKQFISASFRTEPRPIPNVRVRNRTKAAPPSPRSSWGRRLAWLLLGTTA